MPVLWRRRGRVLGGLTAGLILVAAVVFAVGLTAPTSHAAAVAIPGAMNGGPYNVLPAFRPATDTPSCLSVEGDLDVCGLTTRLTFVYDTCWSTELPCYQLTNDPSRSGVCIKASTATGEVEPAACQPQNWISSGSLTLRWRIDTFGEAGLIQIRSASNTSFCLVHHLDQAGAHGRGAVDLAECTAVPERQRLWLLAPYAISAHIVSAYSGKCWQVVDPTIPTSTVVQQPCNAWDSRQKFFVASGFGRDAYPRWSGGSYNNVSRAKLVIYFDLYSKCVNPGTSPPNGEALTVGGCPRFGDQPGNLEYWPAPGYTSSHFRPVASPNRAIDLSLSGGGHEDGRKIQYYTADVAKSNQHWYLVPDMPFDAPHGWLVAR